jgi:hypothetical protein
MTSLPLLRLGLAIDAPLSVWSSRKKPRPDGLAKRRFQLCRATRRCNTLRAIRFDRELL